LKPRFETQNCCITLQNGIHIQRTLLFAGNSLDHTRKSELQFPTTTTFLQPSKPTRWMDLMMIVTVGQEKRLESGSENQKTW
jgi:hypothetical protein